MRRRAFIRSIVAGIAALVMPVRQSDAEPRWAKKPGSHTEVDGAQWTNLGPVQHERLVHRFDPDLRLRPVHFDDLRSGDEFTLYDGPGGIEEGHTLYTATSDAKDGAIQVGSHRCLYLALHYADSAHRHKEPGGGLGRAS